MTCANIYLLNYSLSYPIQVLEIVRAAESLALNENVRPKSPAEHHETLQKTTTIVMSKHTLNTAEAEKQLQSQQQQQIQLQQQASPSPTSQVCD